MGAGFSGSEASLKTDQQRSHNQVNTNKVIAGLEETLKLKTLFSLERQTFLEMM